MKGLDGAIPFPLLPYDDQFRASRKHVRLVVGTRSDVEPYMLLQEIEVRRFLFRVLQKSDKLLSHVRTWVADVLLACLRTGIDVVGPNSEAGAIILKAIYGYTIEAHKPDPLVELAATALNQFSASTVPGARLVDAIPARKFFS
ncbi:hypothetical protein F5Y10DRAFT_236736 [Nemania abortiva]|nr:hypothetical protein F5Y10DRAFT_236736 [Nemania abortiva]